MTVQLIIFSDRLEVINSGGLYGRLTMDMLGKAQLDTGNPVPATALEVMGVTENRYSGIPTIGREMREALFELLHTPKTKKEIADFPGINSVTYAIKTYIFPLVEQGIVEMTIPEAPGSRQQRYVLKK